MRAGGSPIAQLSITSRHIKTVRIRRLHRVRLTELERNVDRLHDDE
jgi:hypothetical protein